MLVIALIVSAAAAVYGILKYKNIYNPFFLQLIVWSVTLGGYFIRQSNYFDITSFTRFCILVGILFLNMGMTLGSSLRIRPTSGERSPNKMFDNAIVILITIISIGAAMCRSIHFIALLFSGFQWNYIRYSLMAGYVVTLPRILKILYTYVSLPASFLSINCFSYGITHNLQQHTRLHLVNIITVFFSDGGRTVIVELIICLFINFAVSQKSLYGSNFIKKHGKSMIVLFSFLFVCLTYTRFNNIEETISSTIDNLSCSIVNFDIQSNSIHGHTYGFLSFQGIALLIPGLRESSITNFALKCYDSINDATQVGPEIIYNSYVTIFYCFYRDFGWMGVGLLSFLTGALAGFFYKRILMEKENIKYLLEYIFFANLLLQSYSTFPFSHIKYSLYFITLIIANRIFVKLTKQ